MDIKKILTVGAGVLALGIIFFSARGTPAEDVNKEYPAGNISHAHGLAVDIADSTRLYIPTHHGLLVLKNEKDLYRIGRSEDDLMGFSIDPMEPDVFYKSGHPRGGGNSGFQVSEDGGFTWRVVSSGIGGPVDFHAMSVSLADPKLIYGWYKGLQKSEDGGNSWEIINRDFAPFGLVAHPKERDVLYAVTKNGILISKDGGRSFAAAFPEVKGVVSFAIHPADTDRLVAWSQSEGLLLSADHGENWKKIPEKFGGGLVLHFAYDPKNPSLVYALTDENRIYKSTDGGDAWQGIY